MVGKIDFSMCQMQAVSLDVRYDFVIKSWEKVKVEIVIKSFKKCGISNAMDGTEDDLLWDTDDDEEIKAPGKEWDPYDELLNDKSEDVLEELFTLDDKCEDFAGF